MDNLNNFEVNKFQNSDNNHEITNYEKIRIFRKNNDININIKNTNNALLKKIDELKKSEEANIKISSFES